MNPINNEADYQDFDNKDKWFTKFIREWKIIGILGALFILVIGWYISSINSEDKALIKIKESIQNLDSSNQNSLKLIKDYQKLIDNENNNIKLRNEKKDKLKEQLSKIIDKFDIIGLFVPRTYAEEKKKPTITYDNLKIEWKDKPPFLLYSRLKDECYAQKVHNKKHCIKTWLSIAYAESSWKDLQTQFWLKSKDKSYKKWVKSYKKFWYKAQDWWYFYGYNKDKLAPTRYCVSEDSSWTVGWCPNWKKNFESIFFNLTF